MAITYVKDIPDFITKVKQVTDITELETTVDQLSASMLVLETTVDQLSASMLEVQGDVTTLAGAMTSANEEIDDIWKSQNILGAKNLMPYPYYSGTTTINDVTITNVGDGSLIFNGTASAAGTYRLTYYNVARSNETLFKIPEGYYTVLGGSSTVELRVSVNASGTSTRYVTDTGAGASFTVSHDLTEYQGLIFELWFANGTVFNNQAVYPMLIPASVKNTTFTSPTIANTILSNRLNCNQTAIGTYTLKATVDSSGVVNYAWTADS